MPAAGLRVPPGFHITTAAYRRFVAENVQEKILATISPISTDQPNTLEEAKPLLNAAAVVTDVGAPRSHAAIVARELGIPAVVGCGNATMRLHTCDRVRVNGGQGTVEILRGAESSGWGCKVDNSKALPPFR
jgi:phosphoenolpyruvate synthase/pyruvate phosphate dikinase